VIEVLVRGLLKRVDLAALRVDSRHDVFDGAIFAGCIHRLKDHQHGPVALSVEQFLQLLETDDVLRQDRLGLFLVHLQIIGIRRIIIVQTKVPGIVDAVSFDELFAVHVYC